MSFCKPKASEYSPTKERCAYFPRIFTGSQHVGATVWSVRVAYQHREKLLDELAVLVVFLGKRNRAEVK
jgi:hypothetical protein